MPSLILYKNDVQKKTARTSQKEEEVGVLPRATEVTGGRRSFQINCCIEPSYNRSMSTNSMYGIRQDNARKK